MISKTIISLSACLLICLLTGLAVLVLAPTTGTIKPASSAAATSSPHTPVTDDTSPASSPLPKAATSIAIAQPSGGLENVPAPSVHSIDLSANQKPSFPSNGPAALVKIGGNSFQTTPNQLGNYPRLLISPREKIPVELSFPQNQPGDPIMVQVEDGGNLDSKAMGALVKVDNNNTVQFDFTATAQPGIYRVRVQNGSSVQVLNFWAGSETALRAD